MQVPTVDGEWLNRVSAQQAFAWLPATTGVMASLTVALAKGMRHPGSDDPANAVVAICAALAVVLALVVAVTLGRGSRRLPAAAVSWVLALHVGVLLSVVPISLLVTRAPAERLTGWILPVLNKRWLIAWYYLAILTVLVFPLSIERWRVRSSAGQPASGVRPPRQGWTGWIRAFAGWAGMIGLCWYLAGPPWHLERYRSWIDWHEQMRLGGLQAISKGYLPFIGPAAFPHGPGTQVIVYAVMKATRHFDLVGFRMGWATLNLIAFMILGSVAYWLLNPVAAFLGCCRRCSYPRSRSLRRSRTEPFWDFMGGRMRFDTSGPSWSFHRSHG